MTPTVNKLYILANLFFLKIFIGFHADLCDFPLKDLIKTVLKSDIHWNCKPFLLHQEHNYSNELHFLYYI